MLLQQRLHDLTGVEMHGVHDPREADLVFCRGDGAKEFLADMQTWPATKPQPLLVSIEDRDAASMAATAEVYNHRRTIAVLKHYSWKGFGGMCPKWYKPMYRHA